MRWYILLALVSLTVLILTDEAEGWLWGSRRRISTPSSSSRRRRGYRTVPSSSGRRRSYSRPSSSRRRRSSSQGCGYLYCYNGGTKYCASGWWSSKKVAKCRCPSWTTRSNCYEITCPQKTCHNGGTKKCRSRGVSICTCRSGYSGSSCQYGCPYKSCYNGGKKYCSKGFLWGGKVAKCRCPRGWGKHDCSEPVCPRKDCKNGGKKRCSNGYAYCICRSGYHGSLCQKGCPPKTCRNKGTKYCANGFLWGGKVAKCNCPPGWGGHDCGTAVCPNKHCKNSGTRYCMKGSAYCRCQPDYSGSNCENGCPPKKCYNKGTKYCVRYVNRWGMIRSVPKCKCPHRWEGHNCRKGKVNKNSNCKKCLNGGTLSCVHRQIRGTSFYMGSCSCKAGFYGSQCQHRSCPKKHCKNRGTKYCVRGSAYCRCQPGYSGSNCENGCPPKKCYNNEKKYCVKGFWGRRVAKCRKDKGNKNSHTKGGKVNKNSNCNTISCLNGGTIVCTYMQVQGIYYGSCACKGGFYGSQCQHRSYCTFYLSTSDGLSDKIISAKSSLTGYLGSNKTVVLIHGWRGAYDNGWIKTSKKELLNKNDVGNVIVLDWGKSHHLFNYDQSVRDTQFVGNKLTELIKHIIKKTKSTPTSFYLVGYSLGAHVAGFAGQGFPNPKLGRITGLDPAGPTFNNRSQNLRLDASDATFVDIIHTDAGFSGTLLKSGHLDFWPNGGHDQDGCLKNLLCDHGRAPELYVESITSRCAFLSYRCANWDDFKSGKCMNCPKNGCPEMGYNAYESKGLRDGNFYLYTNKKPPFCVATRRASKSGDTNISS